MINSSRRDFLRKSLASSVLLTENVSNASVHYPVSTNKQIPKSPQKPAQWENWTQTVYDSRSPRIASLTKIKDDEKIYELIQDESGSVGAGLLIDSKYLTPQK